jgi:hypothetical protein
MYWYSAEKNVLVFSRKEKTARWVKTRSEEERETCLCAQVFKDFLS